MPDSTPGPPIPARAPELFQRALAYALDWHGEQTRKGSDIPYVSHLLQVAGLVLENGGDWEQASAAMVHDSVEDVRGVQLGTIERAFGPRVARIVGDCTDTRPGDTPGREVDLLVAGLLAEPWKVRSESPQTRIVNVQRLPGLDLTAGLLLFGEMHPLRALSLLAMQPGQVERRTD